MSKKTASQPPTRRPAEGVATLLAAQARKAKGDLDACEGKSVQAVLEFGRRLQELRKAAKPQQWGRLLKELKVDPRVASRHMRIVAGSVGRIGPGGSGLKDRLPYDAHKLESLANLDDHQLGDVLREVDVRQMSRADVAKLVRAARCPAADPDQPEAGNSSEEPAPVELIVGRLDRSFQRALGVIIEAVAEGGPEAREALRDPVSSWLSRLSETLDEPHAAECPAQGNDARSPG